MRFSNRYNLQRRRGLKNFDIEDLKYLLIYFFDEFPKREG